MRFRICDDHTLQYVKLMRDRNLQTTFVDKLKVSYRPIIVPFNLLLGHVRNGDRVVDVGCGSGQFCLLVSEFSNPSFVGGIEIDKALVENARMLCEEVRPEVQVIFHQYDGKQFPDILVSADIIFLIDVLHHVPRDRQPQFLQTLFASMRLGGRLVVKDIDASSSLVLFNRLHDLVFSGATGEEVSFSHLGDMLSNAGFDTVEAFACRRYVYPHMIFVVEKLRD